jgi:hypothetical protein
MERKAVPAPDKSGLSIGRRHPSQLSKRHAVGRARCDTGCSGGHPFLRARTLRIFRLATTPGEHNAHSGKDDRLTGVSERPGITARGAGNVRADRRY